MLIYVDDNNQCHVSGDDNMRAVETTSFDGMCAAYIEKFYCEFSDYGYKIFTLTPYYELEKIRLEYENEQLKTQNAEYESALTEIEQALEVDE